MAGPWENYQQQEQDGPWAKYKGSAQKADFSGVRARVDSTERVISAPGATVAPPKQDPRSLFDARSDFYDDTGISRFSPRMVWAALKDTFGSEAGAAEYLAEQSGGRVTQAQDGSPMVSLPNGRSYRINDEGLDPLDAAKTISNVGAFFIPASWAARAGQARNVGTVGRTVAQGLTAGTTDAGLQLAFNGGRIDPTRTAFAAAGGSGGELLGSGIGALARLRNSASSSGRQVASAITNDTTKAPALAKQIDAGTNPATLLGQERYGLTYTQGQRMLDPKRQFDQLSREELLRQNPVSGALFRDQAARNTDALTEALDTIGTRLGGRAGSTPAEMAQGAASRLSSQAEELGGRIGAAYEKAGQGARTAIGRDAVAELPSRLQSAVSEFAPNPKLTPATSETLRQVRNAAKMYTQADGQPSRVAGVTLKALETQRRIINRNIAAATNPSDRAAMNVIKREFDGWLDDSIETSLRSGDPKALDALKEARGLRAEYGRRFEGGGDSDKFIAGLLDGSKTPEELVNIALGASQVSKAGGARFIERLRLASGDDPGVIGNLRAAHFLRMTRGNTGEPLAMGQIVRNIKSTEYNNASVVKALYSPAEWKEIKQLADALDPLVAKGDFARTSGTAERLARMLFQRVGNVPVVGWGTKFVGDTVAAVKADRALNAPLKLPVNPSPLKAAVVGGGASELPR